MTYEWVESHQDLILEWDDLTLEQRLNCTCDTLAKSAVSQSVLSPLRPKDYQYLLPRESAAVFISGVKQTSDVAHDVWYALSKSEALKFYTRELRWTKAVFLSVDWEHLDALLESKSQMYRQWLAKQSSGFCGTQLMVSRWDKSRDDKCPDCGQRENAAHLMRCPDRWQTQLLRDNVDKLELWMANNDTDSELLYWIPSTSCFDVSTIPVSRDAGNIPGAGPYSLEGVRGGQGMQADIRPSGPGPGRSILQTLYIFLGQEVPRSAASHYPRPMDLPERLTP